MTMTAKELSIEFQKATLEEQCFLVSIDWNCERYDRQVDAMEDRISNLAEMIKALEPNSLEAISAKAAAALYYMRVASSLGCVERYETGLNALHQSVSEDLTLSCARLLCSDYCEELLALVPETPFETRAKARSSITTHQ